MVDVARPTVPYAKELLDGIWAEGPESQVQDIADALGMFEPDAMDSIADMRLAARDWEDSTKGRVFDPAGRGLNDNGVFMDAGAGFTTDRSQLVQKLALEEQDAKVDMAKMAITGSLAIQQAAKEGDQKSVDSLISQYRGAIQRRADQTVTALAGHESQHNASVPPPQYIDTNSSSPAHHDGNYTGLSELTNTVVPSTLASYTAKADTPYAPSASPASAGSGASQADLAFRPSGAQDAASAAAPSAVAQAPSSPGGTAAPGGAPAGLTRAMGAAAPASTAPGSSSGPWSAPSGPSPSGGGLPGGGPLASTGSQAPSPIAGRTPAAAPVGPSSPSPAAPPHQSPASTNTSGTAQQGAGVSGGGGAAGVKGAGGGANAATASKAAPTLPAAAAEPARGDLAAQVAAKPSNPYGLANGTLVPGYADSLQAACVTVVRTQVRQSFEHGHGHLHWAAAGMRGGSSSAPRVYATNDEGFGHVPAGNRWDPGVLPVYNGRAGTKWEQWHRGLAAPEFAVVEAFEALSRTPGEEGLKLEFVVTTRTCALSGDFLGKLSMLGAHIEQDELSVAKAEELELPPGLKHRLFQLEPGLERVEAARISEDAARAFMLELAQDAMGHVLEPGHTVLHDVVEHVRAGRLVDLETAKDLFNWRDERRVAAAGLAYDAPPMVVNWDGPNFDPSAAHRKPWWQYCCATLVCQLLRFGDPLETPGSICADGVYEHACAIEDLPRTKQLAAEHKIIESEDRAA